MPAGVLILTFSCVMYPVLLRCFHHGSLREAAFEQLDAISCHWQLQENVRYRSINSTMGETLSFLAERWLRFVSTDGYDSTDSKNSEAVTPKFLKHEDGKDRRWEKLFLGMWWSLWPYGFGFMSLCGHLLLWTLETEDHVEPILYDAVRVAKGVQR